MSNRKICQVCHKAKSDTKTALVDGKYYTAICGDCVGTGDDELSSGGAGYDRRRGYEDNAQDTVQPYDASGKPNVEFLRLYPQAGAKVFGSQITEQLKRKI